MLGVAALFGACFSTSVDGQRYACATDAQCGAGMVCRSCADGVKVCADPDDADYCVDPAPPCGEGFQRVSPLEVILRVLHKILVSPGYALRGPVDEPLQARVAGVPVTRVVLHVGLVP